MWFKTCIILILIFAIAISKAQNTTAKPNGSQNTTTVNPVQVVNFRIPGARLLGLASIFSGLTNRFGGSGFVGRCFGYARKLRMLMPFFIFKLGVIVTTLGFLTLFSLKGLAIGVLLLIMNAGAWISKISFLKGASFYRTNPWLSGGGGPPPIFGRQSQSLHSSPPQVPPAVHLHVHKDHRNDAYTVAESDAPYTAYNDKHGHYVSGSNEEYDTAPATSTLWRDRISKGLRGTKTLAERVELINLYTRLGFDVNSILTRDLEAKSNGGVNLVYPRRVLPTADPNR